MSMKILAGLVVVLAVVVGVVVVVPLLALSAARASQESAIDHALARCLKGQVGGDADGCILSAVAQERSSAGVPPLAVNPSANDLAQGWSDHMASGGCGGTGPWWSLCHNLSGFHMAGSSYSEENVAQGMDCGQDDNYDIVSLWWNSPEHHANIVNPEVNTIGVGSAWSGPALFATEDFQTFGSTAPPAPAPAPHPPVAQPPPPYTAPRPPGPSTSPHPSPRPIPPRIASPAPPKPPVVAVPAPSVPAVVLPSPLPSPSPTSSVSPSSVPPVRPHPGRGEAMAVVAAFVLVGIGLGGAALAERWLR